MLGGPPNTGPDPKAAFGEVDCCENEENILVLEVAPVDCVVPENCEKSTAVRSMPSWEAPLTPDEAEEAAAAAAKPANVGVVVLAALTDSLDMEA